MRYMGAPFADCVVLPLSVQREMVETARTYSDDCAKPLVAQANATPLGARENLVRLGVGALVGLALGIVTARAVWGR